MEELIKQRIEMYEKELEKIGDQINEESNENTMKRLIRNHNEYTAIRGELVTLLEMQKEIK